MIDFEPILADIMAHVMSSPKREVCGLVTVPKGKLTYRPCRNIAEIKDDAPAEEQLFEIHPADYVMADQDGIIAVVHSHLHGSPEPGMADLLGCERSGLPWLIVSQLNGTMKQFAPTGYKAPLIGRPFVHGVLDCFALARDWYATQGIDVLDFDREAEWWEKGADLLTPENFAKAGFEVVEDGTLLPGDGIIMQNGKTDVPNHVGIYLGDGIMLHHCSNRLSCRQPYGGYWEKVTRYVVRHVKK